MTTKNSDLTHSLRRRLYLPAYRTTEAARLSATTAQTVSRWYQGYRPAFGKSKELRIALSYLQLVEVAFVAAFRRYGVSLQRIRQAHTYLSTVFQAEYPFAQLRLQTDGAHILKDLEESENGSHPKMIVADKAGQQAWPEVIAERFQEFEYTYELALRWFPRGKRAPVVVDPRISFGAPIIASAGVATWVLKERYESGETLEELQDDFRIDRHDLQFALEFEGIKLAA